MAYRKNRAKSLPENLEGEHLELIQTEEKTLALEEDEDIEVVPEAEVTKAEKEVEQEAEVHSLVTKTPEIPAVRTKPAVKRMPVMPRTSALGQSRPPRNIPKFTER